MATKKVGEFTFTTGSEPPALVRNSKYDLIRDQVLATSTPETPWVQIGGGGGKVDGRSQALKKRHGDVLEVITRNGELWARPRPKKKATTARKEA